MKKPMIVISNSSPLLALSQVQKLEILKQLFGHVYIPTAVFQETVLECPVVVQKAGILKATQDFLEVVTPRLDYPFTRRLGKGERTVLNLALEKSPDILLIDDKKARNEAKELGFMSSFTTDVIKQAEREFLIPSSLALVQELYQFGIYLP